jgi:hypothetical protein
MDEIRADETGTAGDKERRHVTAPMPNCRNA